MVELPKTDAELQALIDEKVKKATDELISKHNGEMASMRTQHKAEIDKVKKEMGLSAEELAQERAKELAQAQEQELNDLRAYKKNSVLKEKLAKADLPQFLVNDSRLLSAEDGEIDKVIKTIKGEIDAIKPSGATHSTVVNVGGGQPPKDTKNIAEQKMGDAIRQALSK